MNMYAVHFDDDPTKQSVREEHQQDHNAYLQACQERIVKAGVLHREGSEVVVGGLWLVWGKSELDARALIEADPFFVNGLRRTVRVWQFSPSLRASQNAVS